MGRLYAPLDRFVRHRPRRTDRLFPSSPSVIGHRGAAGLARENTYEAFDVAERLGVPFEIDVHLTRYGDLAVIHDDDLDRTTGGTGPVVEATREELTRLCVPLLADVLTRYDDNIIDIEIKTSPDLEHRAHKIVRSIEAADAVERVFITSFDPRILAVVRQVNPEIARGQLIGTFEGTTLAWYQRVVLRNLLYNHRAEPDLIALESSLIDERYFARLKDRGYRILAWTVNDSAEMSRLYRLGVDAIITDRPDVALAQKVESSLQPKR